VELHEDTAVLVSTGGGKSLIYQMAHLLTGKTVVVVEPTVAIIHDQHRSIVESKAGLRSFALTKDVTDLAEFKTHFCSGVIDICNLCQYSFIHLVFFMNLNVQLLNKFLIV